jgi:hypothetical protein
MTQYLLSVYVNDEDMATTSEAEMQATYEAVDTFNQEVVKPTAGDTVVTDGPYVETKEYLGGFWVLEAPDLDAALALARKAALACGGSVEVRPFQDEPAE